jgi:hypothetical protein
MTHHWRRITIATLVSAWLGAAVLVAASVAPAAFAALPSRALAGDVVGRVLPVVFVSGLIVGLAVVVLSVGRGGWRIVFGVVIVAANAAAQFLITPRIAQLRDEIGGAIDIVAADDPRRILFGQLHGASVALLGVAMLGAVIVLVLALHALRQRFLESS